MATINDWLKVRAVERLQIMLDQFAAVSRVQQPPADHVDQKNINGFSIVRIAELQARCDALEAQLEALQETRH